MSGIRPPDCSKLPKSLKNDNDVTILTATFYMRATLTLNGLIGHLPFVNKNNLTLAEVIGRSVRKTFMSVLMVDSYALPLITF